MAHPNAILLRRWFEEVWNQGNAATVDELLDTNARIHGLGTSDLGPRGFKPFYDRFRMAFPDIRLTVEDVIGEGDLAAIRWSATMTHTGDGLGFKATGIKASITGMCFVRIRDGKIMEGWNDWDQLSLLQQLGLVK